MSRRSGIELRQLLTSALLSRLGDAGWAQAAPPMHRGIVLAEFSRPLAGGFAATAELWANSHPGDEPPVEIGQVRIGVTYLPLRALAPLLGDDAWWPVLSHTAGNSASQQPRIIKTEADAVAAAHAIAGLVLAEAVPFAERWTDVDALVQEHRGDDPEGIPGNQLLVPALLAAAGRFDEARTAIGQYHWESKTLTGKDERRFIRQLERWMDSDGDVALLDVQPEPGYDTDAQFSVADAWRASRASADAVDVVRRDGADKTREQQRSMLLKELDRRGRRERPLWIEQQLDGLSASRTDQVQQTVTALRTLGRIGSGIVKVMRGQPVQDMSPPDWLQPPEHATFRAVHAPSIDGWIEVAIDPDARDWLDRVYAAVPRITDSVNLDAWIQPRNDQDGPALDVHLGERPVGTIPTADALRYSAVITAAAGRDELPQLRACLTPRPVATGYLLEVEVPGDKGNGQP